MKRFRFGKKPPRMQEGPVRESRICMVLLPGATAPDPFRLGEELTKHVGVSSRITESKDSIWSVDLGEAGHGFISFMPASIQTGEAEAAASGNIFWPNGAREAAHGGHLIVALLPAKSDARSACLTLTNLACATLVAFGGKAVYWGAGNIANRGDIFLDNASGATLEELPLYLWIRFQPSRAVSGRLGLYTIGLRQFGLSELEVGECSWEPMPLLELVFNVSAYLIQSGPVIKDGDTVGGSEAERITVQFSPSRLDSSRQVYKLLVEP